MCLLSTTICSYLSCTFLIHRHDVMTDSANSSSIVFEITIHNKSRRERIRELFKSRFMMQMLVPRKHLLEFKVKGVMQYPRDEAKRKRDISYARVGYTIYNDLEDYFSSLSDETLVEIDPSIHAFHPGHVFKPGQG